MYDSANSFITCMFQNTAFKGLFQISVINNNSELLHVHTVHTLHMAKRLTNLHRQSSQHQPTNTSYVLVSEHKLTSTNHKKCVYATILDISTANIGTTNFELTLTTMDYTQYSRR